MKCINGISDRVAMNLADINLKYWHSHDMLIDYLTSLEAEHVAMGSYFCDIYFAKTMGMLQEGFADRLAGSGCKLTLVVPQLGEMMLERVQMQLESLLTHCSEISVNDPAMLQWIYQKKRQGSYQGKIVAGRLLIKNFRDMRYPELEDTKTTVFFPAYLQGKADAVELDLVASAMSLNEIPENVQVYLHYPYTYQTCSGACNYSAANNPSNLYMQRNMRCGTNCMNGYLKQEYGRDSMILVGRGVYFPNPTLKELDRSVDRYLYWPVKEFLGDTLIANGKAGEPSCIS